MLSNPVLLPGNDPATDLRGTGFLSLIQLLHLVTNSKTSQFALRVYRLSLDEEQVDIIFLSLLLTINCWLLSLVTNRLLNIMFIVKTSVWYRNLLIAGVTFYKHCSKQS